AAAGVGERYARIAGRTDACRNPRDHFKSHALFVEKQGLAAAVIENERAAPFQPRDDLSLACLFREQVTDGFLLERLRSRHAYIDALGVSSRSPQEARMHERVVQHDVGRGQTMQSADRNEIRVSGSCA